MADLRTNFVGIKSPNPFWLASAPPTDKDYNVVRAFKAGWGGVVWKTLGEEARRSSTSTARATARSMAPTGGCIGFNNIELITDRAAARSICSEIKAGQARLARPRAGRLADGAVRGGELEGDPAARRGDRRATASSSISAARTA